MLEGSTLPAGPYGKPNPNNVDDAVQYDHKECCGDQKGSEKKDQIAINHHLAPLVNYQSPAPSALGLTSDSFMG